ncbi:hypothetical protein [Roseofilum sp. Belize Diploria]|uniref:hypothetical protein n=1 Tax=Roseofilum sp. Belize Diploria TaxID=2821501 RepID=UPI000E8B8E35|nr:hypothetical protein [Roseofilum sp. Belize Diploria]MBP0011085.1 hypothetical protein [Roseofilum sp. Belize Diploria]HBQ97565.1 hypothetical protein [Cyanobacteria bacterium UBA11691]
MVDYSSFDYFDIISYGVRDGSVFVVRGCMRIVGNQPKNVVDIASFSSFSEAQVFLAQIKIDSIKSQFDFCYC